MVESTDGRCNLLPGLMLTTLGRKAQHKWLSTDRTGDETSNIRHHVNSTMTGVDMTLAIHDVHEAHKDIATCISYSELAQACGDGVGFIRRCSAKRYGTFGGAKTGREQR